MSKRENPWHAETCLGKKPKTVEERVQTVRTKIDELNAMLAPESENAELFHTFTCFGCRKVVLGQPNLGDADRDGDTVSLCSDCGKKCPCCLVCYNDRDELLHKVHESRRCLESDPYKYDGTSGCSVDDSGGDDDDSSATTESSSTSSSSTSTEESSADNAE